MERFEAIPRPWGPQKAVGHYRFLHSRWGLWEAGFAMFFAFSRFFSTFQHYTLEKANVLYIKTRSVGAYLDRFEAIPRPWEPPEGRGT